MYICTNVRRPCSTYRIDIEPCCKLFCVHGLCAIHNMYVGYALYEFDYTMFIDETCSVPLSYPTRLSRVSIYHKIYTLCTPTWTSYTHIFSIFIMLNSRPVTREFIRNIDFVHTHTRVCVTFCFWVALKTNDDATSSHWVDKDEDCTYP